MGTVTRFTTRYDHAEDRICLLIELKDSTSSRLWLTRRLLNRLVPETVKVVDTITHRAVSDDPSMLERAHQFDQQAAVGAIKAQPPVVAEDDARLLVSKIAIRARRGRLLIDLGVGNEIRQTLSFNSAELRQWISVLYDCYTRAQWSEDMWPSWVSLARSEPVPARLN
ncbi:MAG: hypothetical protein COA78_00880 [Blastopirellula sp.]|nr:MAG: hypothetical protein COA78_00880 [Blastopirellula sp.]